MNSILIVHQGAIGDFILSLPALEALHRYHPEAGFTFLGYPHILEIIRARPYFKKVHDCNASRWTQLYVQGGELTSICRDSLLQNDSAYVFGRFSIQPLVDNLTNNFVMSVHRIDPFPELGFGAGPAEYQCLQLEKIGIPALPPMKAIVAPHRQDISEAYTFIRQNLSSKERLVLVHPGSGSRKKLWTPIGWLSVIRRLSTDKSLKFALLEGPADSEIVDYLHTRLESISSFSILKNWRLGKLAALMFNSSLYLGNDSGITHLAAACGTPTVALFGPTDPRIWAPQGPQVKIVRWQVKGTFNAKQDVSGTTKEPPPETRIVQHQASEWLRVH